MEGMEGEVYIDNADDNTEMELADQQEEGEEEGELPEEWREVAASVLSLSSGEMFDWSYGEVDIVTLRECADLQVGQDKVRGV